jgi:pentatricopeptide repeat protein
VFAYNFVVSAWARSQLPNGPERAEWYLRRMEQAEDEVTNDGEDHSLTDTSEGKLPRIPVFADVVTYNSVLHAYASSSPRARNRGDEGLNNASQHANSILERMETRYRKNKRPETQPDTLSYSCVLNGFSNAGRANDAQMILDKIMSLSELDEWKACVQPNLICFNTAIDAWAKANDVGGAAEKALALLNKMEELSADNMDEVHLDLQPDTITYSSVISAFARSGRPDAGDRAEELFQRSLRLYQEGNSSLKPDSATFNTVLGALAKQAKALYRKGDGVQSVIERAESLLTRMQEIHEAGDEGVRPCTISYNILLDLYAQIERPEKSAGVLKEMRELYNMGNGHVKPDMYSYNGVLNAWANSKCKEGVTEAEKLLSQMEENANNDNMKPNGVSYNTVMKALAQNLKPSASSARRIEAMLDSMELLPLSGKTGIELNSTPYNICIDAWGKSGSKDSIVRAEQILTRMYEMSEKLNTKAILPCTISYTAIINALSKSGNRNAPQHAERLIEEMIGKNVSPGTMTYNSLINCWARTKQNGAAQKAEEVLLRMRELTASGAANVPPDSVSFSTVINAWANEGHGKRAEEILHHLEKMSEINSNLTATNYAYNSAITAWSRSQDVDAAQKALAVLDRMGQMYENGNKDAFPTLHSYHSGKF